ncbi:S9 family peptidase [Candidatus Leptofilum sp.]|uniref:S9 family peptidase n=1 Tax=Candidatus Leptofilum sp. TaxID=3241576 RepID=UPI003B592183
MLQKTNWSRHRLAPTLRTAYNLPMADKTQLSLDRIFSSDDFKAKTFGPARWLDDDSGYTTLEAVENQSADEDSKVKELVRYDIVSGTRTVLVTAEMLTPPNADNPLILQNYDWSPDSQRLLIYTNSQRVWRQNTRGDYWVLDLADGKLRQLGKGLPEASLMFAKFSPDSQSVAYVSAQNLYVENIASGDILQLTQDGSDHIINGTSDWVYEEEFHLRDGFKWSEDGRTIAYWQFNTDGIETFYMINNTDSLYPKLIPLPYPKVGTINSACRVGVVAATGGATTWFDLPGDPRQHYVPKMEWAASNDQVVIQQLNRLQNKNVVWLGNVADGSVTAVHTETDDAWIDVRTDDLHWLDDGQSFTWVSDRNGRRQLFRISRDGWQAVPLTAVGFDVVSVEKVVEADGRVYFIASPDNPTQRYLFSTDLTGEKPAQQITPANMPGCHSYDISPNGKYVFHTYSAFNKPPVVSLISLPDHKQLRVLEGNEKLEEMVTAVNQPVFDFFQVTLDGGTVLDGWCLKPPGFDPTQKYPLLFYVYGEPAGQTVMDNWGGKAMLWHMMLAQQGFIIMSLDNRGTPAPRGRAWRKSVYRQIGILATADQAAAAKKIIATYNYIDPERLGVWGWSGGGSMTLNLMFKHGDIYKTGIAIAAVSDQRFYDTIYQERYMGLPDDNEAGFHDGSPINFAHQLQGKLLIIHGTADDNVHYQSAEAVINKLIEHNKPFDMMAYPNRAHGIKEGENTTRHLYGLLTRYLIDNLKNR